MLVALPGKAKAGNRLLVLIRLLSLLAVLLMFFPDVSPAKVSGLISKNVSLFTAGTSYATLVSDAGRAFLRGWVQESSFRLLSLSSLAVMAGIALAAACGCMSLGNLRFKRLAVRFALAGSLLQAGGLAGIFSVWRQFESAAEPSRVKPLFPGGFFLFAIMAGLLFLLSLACLLTAPRPAAGTKYEMHTKYRLFLMFLPFAVLAFVFAYLPLYGWRYAFFDYKAGGVLSAESYTGFKWFTYLFQNSATRSDMVRVLRNTLAMSGLGILTSWCPMALAICLAEFRNKHFSRGIQTVITIPNFISWVLVYAVAMAMFSTDGFLNGFLAMLGVQSSANHLMGNTNTWMKMLLWGMWKGIGWSTIVYVATISSIDPQLYEAATVDGAGRFRKIWHITIPGLLPTYSVLLLLSVASILSNGMEQYYVFENAQNTSTIEVLDLFVYNLGIENGLIPLSTVVGMMKTLVSLVLLMSANRISRLVRGESIV